MRANLRTIHPRITTGALQKKELAEAGRIVRVAFSAFLGLPNPDDFMGDRDFVSPRFGCAHVKMIGARDSGRLIGSNVVTRWGSFGFFGPLSVLPEYWDRGVAQLLLEATMKVFARWGVNHSGLFTFAQSPKHVSLYQKFGYWPGYLTALMSRTPESGAGSAQPAGESGGWTLLGSLAKAKRDAAIRACAKLTDNIHRGLDLSAEIRAAQARHTGETVLVHVRGALDAFAVCMTGPGSEGGERVCYIKFGAARGGTGAGRRFERLLSACDAFAASRGTTVEAGMSLAREDAYRQMRAHGYRTTTLGVSMQHPHVEGFNRGGAYVMDDWR